MIVLSVAVCLLFGLVFFAIQGQDDSVTTQAAGTSLDIGDSDQVVVLSRTTADGVQLGLGIDDHSPLLEQIADRVGHENTTCLPDLAYRLTVAVDGAPAHRPNSDPVIQHETYPTAESPAILHAVEGLGINGSFEALANAYVVRVYDDSVTSVTVSVAGDVRDTAPVEDGWAVLGYELPGAPDGNVTAAAGIGEPIDLTLHRGAGDQVLSFTNYDPSVEVPRCN